MRLLWGCPAELIEKAQAACKGLERLDVAALQDAARGYGHLEAWLERAGEWLPLLEKGKPWQLVERWEDRYGTSPALERLRYTAVFHAVGDGRLGAGGGSLPRRR